jgi:hypothetical protein
MKQLYEYAHSPFAKDPDSTGRSESGQDLAYSSRFTCSGNAANVNNHNPVFDYHSLGTLPEQDLSFFPPPRTADLIRVNSLNRVAHSQQESRTLESRVHNDIFTADPFLQPCSDLLFEKLAPISVSQDQLIPLYEFEDIEKSTDANAIVSAELSSDSAKNNTERHGSHAIKNHMVFY